MTASTDADVSGVIEGYGSGVRALTGAPDVPRAPGYDELVGAEGIHPEDEALATTVERFGPAGLAARAREADRHVRSDGITYGSTERGEQARKWSIDPLPVIVTPGEWDVLQAGVEQRTRLLDALLRDIYGERTLMRRGVLPPEVVLGHPGFVRQADGIELPGRAQLVLSATDIARARDGSWLAFGDRTEAPPGAGYAMATRRIVARTLPALHRSTRTRRLRGFFHTVRSALLETAAEGVESPRVVVLSPGAVSWTAFDQAFLATLLGFPLVEAEDLAMRDGQVWLRGQAGDLQRVDVILRRVAADWADPLELNSASQLGVPGLIDSARRGQVSVVNPMGSGVLENPALMPFLPDVSRALLGEDLALEQPTSWWCGHEQERRHVLGNLERLVLKPQGTTATTATRFGWLLDAAERDELRSRIEAEPWAWTAQEPLPDSTAPVITGQGLQPRRLVLRAYAVSHADGVEVMPGALGRVAGGPDQDVVSDRAGIRAKDVWVLADPEAQVGPEPVLRRTWAMRLRGEQGVSPRVADDLYWMGRYSERIESTARLLGAAGDLSDDFTARPGTMGAQAMAAVQQAVAAVTGIPASEPGEDGDRWSEDPQEHLRRLILDTETPGTVGYALARLVQAAQRVRDQLSLDTWPVLSRLESTLATASEDDTVDDLLEQVLQGALALAGILQQSMIRDATWAYVDAGVRVERSRSTLALIRATLRTPRAPVVEGQVAEAVLLVGESVITHRRRTAAGQGPTLPAQSALDLLLLDRANPRSVAFGLQAFAADLRLIGETEGAATAERAVSALSGVDLDDLGGAERTGLDELLADLDRCLDDLTSAMSVQHFSRQSVHSTMPTEWTFGAAAAAPARTGEQS